jgi:hypothetical protein
MRTQRNAKARHFCKASGNQCGSGVEPQLQTIAQTCGDGQDIFDCATYFDADNICVGIDTQVASMESLHQSLSDRGMHTRRHQSSGLPHRHFLRKTRSTQNTAQQLRCD